ncbi:MAG: glycosyltransferase family 4 protein [Ectothiorhodospiraceae bacterium]|nr:glycosyltransferase family 4 protein [Ectothiorhodospiraceae bacterium]
MRVTHVVRQYLPSVGGMEEVVRNIAANQSRRAGQEARIVTLNRLFRNSRDRLPARDMIDGIPVRRLAYTGSSRYPLCPQVLRHLGEADVVHVHGVDFFYDFLALTRRLHRRPLVLSTHGGFFHTAFASRLKQIWFGTITKASARAYQSVVATSENDGARFADIVPAGRLQVIENGVDTDKYAGAGARALNRTLIYFGRWSGNKGLVESLALMEVLTALHPGWRLIIAGREYDYTTADLQAELQRRGLEGSVELHPSPTDHAMRELIAQASWFLCLSRHEGFGLAAIEAMSAGLTPVLSDIPPFRRLVDTSGMGLAVPAATPAALADRICTLHAEGDDAFHRRRESAMAFADRYSWRHVADRYLDVYERLGGHGCLYAAR